MTKFAFADGQNICVYDGEKVNKYPSDCIERYKRNAENARRSSEWKTSGENAVFRGDASYSIRKEPEADGKVTGIYPTENQDWVVYSFEINGTSGIYKKCLSDEKTPETHVINSNQFSFGGGMLNARANLLATTLSRGYYNSDIALFDLKTDEYKSVTDGDTLDIDPYISPVDNQIIYFSSRGAGRDSHGEFVKFAPAVVCKLDLHNMTVDEILASPKYNYFKPVMHGGKLYAIKAPVNEKRVNPLLEIVLLPWRILQALASFINVFVTAFTGKSLTEGGSNPARGRDYDSKKIFVSGNLIDVEKQLKKNASKKDTDFGFIPRSWELIEADSGKSLASGVGDYDIADDGTIVYTNGKRIFALKDGKRVKLANADFCVKVGCLHGGTCADDEPFGF